MSNTKNQTKEYKLLKPKNDIVFQSLFNQNNEKITKAFVEALLDEKINKIVINNDKELHREKPDDKLGILDLQIDVNDSEKVDVEIQLIEKSDFTERILFYLSKLFYSQVNRGEMYFEAKRTVLIAIIDYSLELTREIKKIETIWNLRENNQPQLKLTDLIELHIIELNKVTEFYKNNPNSLKAQWMLFLENPDSMEVKKIMEKNEEIKEATVIVHEMSQDEKMQRLADLRKKAIMDEKSIYRTGLLKGEKAGLEKRTKTTVLNLPVLK